MNKKFFTLIGCLLISLVFSTVMAHNGHYEYRPYVVNADPDVSAATPIKNISSTQWYQLKAEFKYTDVGGVEQTVTGFLVSWRNPETGELFLRVENAGDSEHINLLRSLWRIEYKTEHGAGGGGEWVFVNKETNMPIAYDHTASQPFGALTAPRGSYIIERCDYSYLWEWYAGPKQANNFGLIAPYQYVHDAPATGNIMYLKVHPTSYRVYSVVGAFDKIIDNDRVKESLQPLKLQPVIAKEVVLNPEDVNSMIDYNQVSWDKNEAGFLFFKPNGNAMNLAADRMTPEATTMKEADRYEAKYRYAVLGEIFYDAVNDYVGRIDNNGGPGLDLLSYGTAYGIYVAGKEGLTAAAKARSMAYYEYWDKRGIYEDWVTIYNDYNTKYTADRDPATGVRARAITDALYAYYFYTQGFYGRNAFGTLAAPGFVHDFSDKPKSSLHNGLKANVDAAITDVYDVLFGFPGLEPVEQVELALNLTAAVDEYFNKGFMPYSGTDAYTNNAYWTTFIAQFEQNTGLWDSVDPMTEEPYGDLKWYAKASDLFKKMNDAEAEMNDAQGVSDAAAVVLTQRGTEYAAALITYQGARTALAVLVKTASGRVIFMPGNPVWDRLNYILDEEFLALEYLNDGKETFLMVDTDFWQKQEPAAAQLKISHKKFVPADNSVYKARYYFNVTYYATQDSLVIEPLNASVISRAEYDGGNLGSKWENTFAGTHFVYGQEDVYDAQNATSASNSWIAIDTDKKILLKLEELHTSKLCLTAGRQNNNADNRMKTRIAFNNPYKYLTRATLPQGLFFIKAINQDKNVVANFEGNLMYDAEEDVIQDYNLMPATMFVVEKAGCKTGERVIIHNREYGELEGDVFEGQWYVDADGHYFTLNYRYDNAIGVNNELYCGDKYEFIPVEDLEALGFLYHGYQYLTPDDLKFNVWKFKHNNALHEQYLNLVDDNYVGIDEKGFVHFELDTAYYAEWFYKADQKLIWGKPYSAQEFGYGAGVSIGEDEDDLLPQLYRYPYAVKLKDVNLLDNDTTYIALVKDPGKTEYYKAMGIKDIRAGKGTMAFFYLKADQIDATGRRYYVLVDTRFSNSSLDLSNGVRQGHVNIGNMRMGFVYLNNTAQERASAFALVKDNRDLYFNLEEKFDVAGGENINLFRYRGTAKEYMYEDANGQTKPEAQVIKDLGYLGLTGGSIVPKGDETTTALYVDNVVKYNVRMPQYMLAVDADSIADGWWCNTEYHGYFATEKEANDHDKTHVVEYNGYVAGRFLINFSDSISAAEHVYHKPDLFKWQSYTRLGFVEGVHMYINEDEAEYFADNYPGVSAENAPTAGEYFFVLHNGYTLKDIKNAGGHVIPSKLFDPEYTNAKKFVTGKHNNWSFSFRIIEDDKNDFLLESNREGVSGIGSFVGAWVKVQNGVPVLAEWGIPGSGHEQAPGGIAEVADQAERLNILETNEYATGNEEVDAAAQVKVVAGQGTVTIYGAAGKNVSISNVLGQGVANGAIGSDSYTISVPKGIVVVAVDGEKAVKAVVK